MSKTAETASEQNIAIRVIFKACNLIKNKLIELENAHHFSNLNPWGLDEKVEGNSDLNTWIATELKPEEDVVPVLNGVYRISL